eukprot:822114-Amorphochlora_amoeboformis.AAC.1
MESWRSQRLLDIVSPGSTCHYSKLPKLPALPGNVGAADYQMTRRGDPWRSWRLLEMPHPVLTGTIGY